MLDTLLCILISIQAVLWAGAAIHILSHVDTTLDSTTEKIQSFCFFLFSVAVAFLNAAAVIHLLERMGAAA